MLGVAYFYMVCLTTTTERCHLVGPFDTKPLCEAHLPDWQAKIAADPKSSTLAKTTAKGMSVLFPCTDWKLCDPTAVPNTCNRLLAQ